MNKLFKFSLFMILFFCLTSKAMALDITLEWTANTEPDVIGYRVYHHIDPNSPYGVMATLGKVTTYTAVSLTADVHHEFVVTAIDQADLESGYSDPARVIWIRTITCQNSGLYTVGNQIDIKIHFSEPVSTHGGGGLTVVLNSGQTISIPGFTNIQDLTFCYTVAEGDYTDHLDVTTITIDPNTTLTSTDETQEICNLYIHSNLAANSDIRVDTERPTPPGSLRIPCK